MTSLAKRPIAALKIWEQWGAVEVASVILIAVCLAIQTWLAWYLQAFDWIGKADFDTLPLLRVGGAAAAFMAACWALRACFGHFTRNAKTAWWEPNSSPGSDSLTWPQVYQLVAFDDEFDPISRKKSVRWGWWWRSVAAQGALYLFIWGSLLSVLDFLVDPTPRTFLLQGTLPPLAAPIATALGNPIAYLALIVGLATIFFTFRQIRAKVRADSRKQWIIQARKLLGEVVALIDMHRRQREDFKNEKAEETWAKLNPLRLELELMLNPSEKDHRFLLHLIQRFCAWRKPEVPIQDAEIMKKSISATICSPNDHAGRDHIQKLLQIADEKDRAKLVSYIIRLSHVVLKREWERVKHTR